jgi:hypothetical protein
VDGRFGVGSGLLPLGTVINAVDPVYGGGEFIFLKGVASTVVGSLVTYDQNLGTTVSGAGCGWNWPCCCCDVGQRCQPVWLVSDQRHRGGQGAERDGASDADVYARGDAGQRGRCRGQR